MKNALLIMFTIGLLSCNNRGIENENGVEFDCKKIVGKYKLDVVEAVKENSSEDSKLINGLAAELLGGTISCDVNFYENGKGSMSFDAGWIGTLTDTKDEIVEFSYSLKDDSFLVINNKDLVIKTFSDNFDHLVLVDKESGKQNIYNRVKKTRAAFTNRKLSKAPTLFQSSDDLTLPILQSFLGTEKNIII